MQRLVSLWKNESEKGNIYYTGKLGELSLIAFENNNKTNEKQPDLTIYVKEEKKKEEPTEKKVEEKDPFEEFGEQIPVDDAFLD